MVLLNLDVQNEVEVSFQLNGNANSTELFVRHEYHLTSSSLGSTNLFLNGDLLQSNGDGTLPKMEPTTVTGNGAVVMTPGSYAFIEFPKAGVTACM